MPVSIASSARKSTIVRAFRHRSTCPFLGDSPARVSHATVIRDRPQEPQETRFVVIPQPDRPEYRPTRLQRLMVPVLTAIVAGYAIAVVARVIVAYGA